MNDLLVDSPGLYFHHFVCAGGSERERLVYKYFLGSTNFPSRAVAAAVTGEAA